MPNPCLLSRTAVKNGVWWVVLVAVLFELACGLIPERVSHEDSRLKRMFDAMARVDRRAIGFTPIAREADIRVEWVHRRYDSILRLGPKNYDVMLHVSGKTSRTVALKRTDNGYEWIGEQETFEGPRKYHSVDGTFNEAITITYDRVPISGHPINTVAVEYWGEEPDLAWPQRLSLEHVRPWLTKWGYD
jgi:hypothetical protein